MPIRNPFRKAVGVEPQDENQRPGAGGGFQQTPVAGARPVEIKEPTEYKLSGKICPSLQLSCARSAILVG
jgi:hypothetical protein